MWYRPYDYDYYNHWSWGSRAEWGSNSSESFHDSHGEGDDDQGSGTRSEEHPAHESAGNGSEAWGHRRSSGNSSGAWTGESSTRATPGEVASGQEAPGHKGSFSEKMAVPSFDASSTGDDLGVSARSYLRQVDAWVKVTRTPKAQQALLLYQHLSGRAWVESEELSVDDLGGENGLKIYRAWIQERYQEVEVSKIAESLTAFFRRLKRQPGQTIREFNSAFDRSHSRLLEIDCRLPEVAKAWAYLSALSLSNSEELALLASVGNEYNTTKLQRAAVLHEKSLRPPWQPRKGITPEGKGIKATFMTEVDEVDEDGEGAQPVGDDPITEEEAILMHEAFVAQETAKSRYREIVKARGVDPRVVRDGRRGSDDSKQTIEDRLAQAKARSFCAGCGRKGHWHKDSTCPLNARQKPSDQQVHVTSTSVSSSVGAVVQVAYEVGNLGGSKLLAITDTACNKTVTGQKWLDDYLKLARAAGIDAQFINTQDDFRFGASRLFRASYTASIVMEVNGKHFVVRASVVDGEVPLLLSRNALSRLGMIYDIENHSAQFKHLGIDHFKLLTTDNDHPAIQVNPSGFTGQKLPTPQEWDDDEVKILSVRPQYTAHSVHMTSEADPFDRSDVFDTRGNKFPPGGPLGQLMPKIFYPKKIDATVQNMLCASPLNSDLFAAWWGRTPISKDFWIETTSALVRVHVVPRRGFFDPTQWTTHQQNVKQDLLRVIGEVRSTSAVSCTSLRAMQSVHDAWKTASDTSHPVLWIGRTIFSRASCSGFAGTPPSREKPSGTGNGVLHEPGGERVAHEQDPTPGEGAKHGDHDTSLVECGRAAAADSGKEEGDGTHVRYPQRAGVHEQDTAPRAMPHLGAGGAREGDERPPHPDDPGLMHKEQRGCRGDVWTSPRKALQGGSPELPGMGHPRGEGEGPRRIQPRPCQSEHLRGPDSSGQGRLPPGPGGDRGGADPAGEFLGVIVERGVVRADTPGQGTQQDGGAHEQAEEPDASSRVQGFEEDYAYQEDSGPQRARGCRDREDESGCAPGRPGGSGGSHGQTGFATRQVQPLRGCGSGTYESEGEPTEGQQGSPDGLKVFQTMSLRVMNVLPRPRSSSTVRRMLFQIGLDPTPPRPKAGLESFWWKRISALSLVRNSSRACASSRNHPARERSMRALAVLLLGLTLTAIIMASFRRLILSGMLASTSMLSCAITVRKDNGAASSSAITAASGRIKMFTT